MKKRHSLIHSFKDAFTGVAKGFERERNIKIHFATLFLVTVLGIYWRIQLTEWLLVTLAATMVIGFEMVNTALECLVDLVEPNENPLAAQIKQIAAGAVLLASIAAVLIGLAVFGPHIWSRL